MDRGFHFLRKLDIGRDIDHRAVEGDRGQVPERLEILVQFQEPASLQLILRENALLRIDVHPASGSVHDHHIAGRDLRKRHLGADDRRDLQGPRDDRRVGGRSSHICHESQYVPTVHMRGVRRGEVAGHDDDLGGQVFERPALLSAELGQHAMLDIEEIGRALPEPTVLRVAKGPDDLPKRPVEDVLRVSPFVADLREDLRDKRAILNHHQVTVEDPGILLSQFRSDLSVRSSQFLSGLPDALQKAGDLPLHLFRRDGPLLHPAVLLVVDEGFPDGDAWGCRNAPDHHRSSRMAYGVGRMAYGVWRRA